MKVSYNWLKSYLDFNLNEEELSQWLTALGLEVEGVEKFESVKGGLKGIVTGEVLTCEQHPNADRLKVTTVNVGGETPLHIVCGAPNVAAGQKVLVATIGTKLYSTEGEAWEIKKSKIRGEVSEGMICAEDELGLGESHDGILVLDPDTEVGIPAAELFEIEDDSVYEIGLTPNRSDGTCHLGVARDLAAGLGYHRNEKIEINYPSLSREVVGEAVGFSVKVENPELCPRYAGLIIKNIKVGESPEWLKNRLTAIGVRPINNAVDTTNFVLHEYGQPLHAFDLEKVGGNGIVVTTLPQGTKFKTLDEVERELDQTDLMICDAELNPMCIGGVFGGIGSGVTSATTSIFLESAHFDPESIRKTSMRHNLRTDAAKVFEKGSDPNIADEAMWRAANMMKELCGATVHGPVFDLYPEPILKKSVKVRLSRINQLIGIELTNSELERIFDYLNFKVEQFEGDNYQLLIPTDKSDVLREVDVIEEVLRIYGYDRVSVSSKLKTSLVHSEGQPKYALRNELISRLNARGMHQMMNLSLSRSALYKEEREDLVHILNTSNSHLDIMRPDMLQSAVEAVAHNTKYQNRNVQLFEFGFAYQKTDTGYNEKEILSVIMTGNRHEKHWSAETLPADFYEAKSAISSVLPAKVFRSLKFSERSFDRAEYGQTILKDKKEVGRIVKIAKDLLSDMDVDQPVYYTEVDFDFVFAAWNENEVVYQEISKFPGVQRDIAVVVGDGVTYEQLSGVISAAGTKRLQGFDLFDIYKSEKHLGAGKKSMAVRMDFIDFERTLKDKEVDKMVNKILQKLNRELGAELR